jgi:hypothetical protein
VQCISWKGRRGIFIGSTISSIVLGVLLLSLGYVLSYQTDTTFYCASYSYTSYGWYYCSNYDYYYTSLYSYSSGTIISLYVFGGLFLGVGIILLAVGGYLIWSGKLFNKTTRVQPAMVQNV